MDDLKLREVELLQHAIYPERSISCHSAQIDCPLLERSGSVSAPNSDGFSRWSWEIDCW